MNLRLDWVGYEAAKYAVEKWHYSRCMPAGKLVRIGVWEEGEFVGAVIFGRGASPPVFKSLKMEQTELCELVRVALRPHQTPVSRIISIAIKMLRKLCPGLRAIISFADSEQDHVGGIYQAGNWLYLGTSISDVRYEKHGKLWHPRSLGLKYGRRDNAFLTARGYRVVEVGHKYRYLYVLDKTILARYKPLPYPKKCAGSIAIDASPNHGGEGGVVPTPALQKRKGRSPKTAT